MYRLCSAVAKHQSRLIHVHFLSIKVHIVKTISQIGTNKNHYQIHVGETSRDGTADSTQAESLSRQGQLRWASRFHPGSYLGELGRDGTQGSTLIDQDQSNASISARSAEMGQPIPPRQSLYLGELNRDGTQG